MISWESPLPCCVADQGPHKIHTTERTLAKSSALFSLALHLSIDHCLIAWSPPCSVRISPTPSCHPLVSNPQPLRLCLAIHTLLTISPLVSLRPSTSALSYLGTLRHLGQLTVILPSHQDYLKIIKTIKIHHSRTPSCGSSASAQPHTQTTGIYTWTLFVGVWFYLRYQ